MLQDLQHSIISCFQKHILKSTDNDMKGTKMKTDHEFGIQKRLTFGVGTAVSRTIIKRTTKNKLDLIVGPFR
uniref:Uncharacterized protein n=1 Tax=Romanomermis culicivorax TaxID=13658 RepID=A0A915KGW1_ROMCU